MAKPESVPPIPLVIVAAAGRNGAIGRGNALPWTMPGDLAHFRETTMGKPLIMGRRTFEAIGRVLPGRETILVTRRGAIAAQPGLLMASSPGAALEIARSRAKTLGAAEIILAGGASLFAALMPQVSCLHLTLVDLAPEADTFFPVIDPTVWTEVSRHVPTRHPGDEAACVFIDYVRRS